MRAPTKRVVTSAGVRKEANRRRSLGEHRQRGRRPRRAHAGGGASTPRVPTRSSPSSRSPTAPTRRCGARRRPRCAAPGRDGDAQIARSGAVPMRRSHLRGFLRREPPPARSAAVRGAGGGASGGLEVRVHGQPLPGGGARHVPRMRVCVKCHAIDHMTPSGSPTRRRPIATFTVDRLAYSIHRPSSSPSWIFEGGGRFQCEMTDVDRRP